MRSPRLMLRQIVSSVGKMVDLPNCLHFPQFWIFFVALVSNQNFKMNKGPHVTTLFQQRSVSCCRYEYKCSTKFFRLLYFCGSPWFFLNYITQLRVSVFSRFQFREKNVSALHKGLQPLTVGLLPYALPTELAELWEMYVAMFPAVIVIEKVFLFFGTHTFATHRDSFLITFFNWEFLCFPA